jgi:predicted Zn-dependent protease
LRLKIVKVQPGDTAESLSTRMALPLDHPVERFRVLNGLEPDEEVKGGDLVKIIVE